jgi:hypothetical protein
MGSGEFFSFLLLLNTVVNISPCQSFKSKTVIRKAVKVGYTRFNDGHSADPMTGFDDTTAPVVVDISHFKFY